MARGSASTRSPAEAYRKQSIEKFDSMVSAVSQAAKMKIGDRLHLEERAAGSGGESWWKAVSKTAENGKDIVATPLNINISLQIIKTNKIDVAALGAVRNGTDQTAIVQAAVDLMRGSETLGGTPTFGGVDGGIVFVPQGVQFDATALTHRPNVTIHQDTGQHLRIYLNGENVSGAVNEIRMISGFHPGFIREVHTDYTLDTLASGQAYSHRISDIWNVNGSDVWQLANDITAENQDDLTLQALNSSKQTMHWHHNGAMRYGRLDGVQDYSLPAAEHVFNKGVIHQNDAKVSHTFRIVAPGVKDTINISGVALTSPCVITCEVGVAHNLTNGGLITISGVAGTTELNGNDYTVANINATNNTFELSGINATGFTTYTSGGVISPKVLHQKITQLQTDGELTTLDDAGSSFISRLTDDGKLRILKGVAVGRYTTGQRNALTGFTALDVGLMIYDTTLTQPVWLRTTAPQWADAQGVVV